MQHNPLFQNYIPISMDTSASTKQQSQPHQFNPFQITMSRQFTPQNKKIQSKISWSNNEKLRYSIFVCFFRDFFNNLSFQSLNWNVFKAMSKFIKSRNPQQCRSHHIKLVNKLKGIKKFLKLVIKRIKQMRGKMIEAQAQLESIQQQFELYVQKLLQGHQHFVNTKLIVRQESKKLKIDSIQISSSQSEKIEKEQNFKTAEDYGSQQNPVNNNNNQSIIGNKIQRENIQAYVIAKPKPIRLSLPSFGEIENNQIKNVQINNLEIIYDQNFYRKPLFKSQQQQCLTKLEFNKGNFIPLITAPQIKQQKTYKKLEKKTKESTLQQNNEKTMKNQR